MKVRKQHTFCPCRVNDCGYDVCSTTNDPCVYCSDLLSHNNHNNNNYSPDASEANAGDALARPNLEDDGEHPIDEVIDSPTDSHPSPDIEAGSTDDGSTIDPSALSDALSAD